MKNDARRLLTRRNFLKFGGIGCAGVAGGAIAAKWEAGELETTFKSIGGLGLSERIRVLHLSDFHASWCVPWKLIRESVERGMAEKPDLVVLTGDYISKRTDDLSGYPHALAALGGHPHCYASFGNHDGKYERTAARWRARDIETVMKESGVRFLVNEALETEIRGSRLRIAGLGDLWRKETRPHRCLTKKESAGPLTLLLSHNPDTKELVKDYAWDVMFCGHTHGGQVVVPFFNWAPRLPVEDKSMVAGIYPWDGRHIHITRGVGNLMGIRFACRPEVSLIDLS